MVPSPKTALRSIVTHGEPAALNACWKLRATGVWLFGAAATWLIITTRGSAAAYSLSARSPRAGVVPSLARTSSWASSDISQARKFQACSVYSESFEMPMPSPPTNVDWPPFGPEIGTTPVFTVSSAVDRRVAGYGMTPTWPFWNSPTQVAPVSSCDAGWTAPASHSSRQTA